MLNVQTSVRPFSPMDVETVSACMADVLRRPPVTLREIVNADETRRGLYWLNGASALATIASHLIQVFSQEKERSVGFNEARTASFTRSGRAHRRESYLGRVSWLGQQKSFPRSLWIAMAMVQGISAKRAEGLIHFRDIAGVSDLLSELGSIGRPALCAIPQEGRDAKKRSVFGRTAVSASYPYVAFDKPSAVWLTPLVIVSDWGRWWKDAEAAQGGEEDRKILAHQLGDLSRRATVLLCSEGDFYHDSFTESLQLPMQRVVMKPLR